MATQKNHLVENNQLRIGSVIKLEEYAANVLSKDPPKVVVILLNFEIIGEMDPNAKPAEPVKNESHFQQPKHVQNENIEPNKPDPKTNQSNAKSFFNNKDSQVQKSNPSTNQPGMFNSFKIFGISSLNPYQNK